MFRKTLLREEGRGRDARIGSHHFDLPRQGSDPRARPGPCTHALTRGAGGSASRPVRPPCARPPTVGRPGRQPVGPENRARATDGDLQDEGGPEPRVRVRGNGRRGEGRVRRWRASCPRLGETGVEKVGGQAAHPGRGHRVAAAVVETRGGGGLRGENDKGI